MAQKQVNAILWRSYLTSTSDALWGERTNQYYIDLPKSDYENFFGGRATKSADSDGNQIFTITLEPYDGEPPAETYSLTFKKLREGTGRAGSWNMNGQFKDGAYALWQMGRGPIKQFAKMNPDESKKNYILILRDLDGGFHGRWIQESDFMLLPQMLQNIIGQTSAGWKQI